MTTIDPDGIYTTQETQVILKVSKSTIKRYLKRGIIKAVKVGGRYKIFGHEILKALSPDIDKKATNIYQKLKNKTKEATKDW